MSFTKMISDVVLFQIPLTGGGFTRKAVVFMDTVCLNNVSADVRNNNKERGVKW